MQTAALHKSSWLCGPKHNATLRPLMQIMCFQQLHAICQPLHFALQPDQAVSQGPLQLLEGLTSSDSSLPAGFLEDLVSRIEPDDLPDLVVRLSKLSVPLVTTHP